ncbi:MAG: YdcF family protein [Bryobacteraceae bacterium]|nr:YdcF family protein [Bryobacteraceae bacterium]MDW8377732.1 YdcF family protein [Bryobacterales bacterium]
MSHLRGFGLLLTAATFRAGLKQLRGRRSGRLAVEPNGCCGLRQTLQTMTRFSLFLVCLLSAGLCAGQKPGPPSAQPVEWRRPLASKNFYLLSLLEQSAELRQALKAETTLAQLAAAKRTVLERECSTPLPKCYAEALRWTQPEIESVAVQLSRFAKGEFDAQLRSSGAYVRHHGLPPGELAARAWMECARGINHVIDVFALGVAPRYPLIDSPAFDPKSERFVGLLRVAVSVLRDVLPREGLFFDVPMEFALALLEANWRDEAGRFEPLHRGENAKAYAAIETTRWERYPYPAILVPGAGPDRPGMSISPWGKFRVRLAAKRYHDGKAPFLIVSGGYVHPAQTPFCEALEMKRALMRDYGVPESAILIEPHARHTTTNIRNAARLIYRYGMPFDRPLLLTTDLGQSQYIESQVFAQRCLKELGYLPFELVKRTSPSDLEIRPKVESLHIDPMDPLDP